MTDLLIQIAGLLLIVFTIVAAYDGFYLHLIKYRLFARKDCLYEHKLHTLNAILFPATILCLFASNTAGAVLWAGVFFTLLSFTFEFFDVLTEKDSRSALGGLTPFESLLHFAMGILRTAYTVFVIASKPAEAWELTGRWSLGPYPAWIETMAWCIVASGVFAAFTHLYLMKTGSREVALQR